MDYDKNLVVRLMADFLGAHITGHSQRNGRMPIMTDEMIRDALGNAKRVIDVVNADMPDKPVAAKKSA